MSSRKAYLRPAPETLSTRQDCRPCWRLVITYNIPSTHLCSQKVNLSKRNKSYGVTACCFKSAQRLQSAVLKEYNNMSSMFTQNEVAIWLPGVLMQLIHKLVHTNPTAARICLVMIIFYRAVTTSFTPPCMECITHIPCFVLCLLLSLSVMAGSVPCVLFYFPRCLA